MGKNHEHDAEELFFRILARLATWYSDPTKARNLDGAGRSHPGSRPLWLQEDHPLQAHLDHWVWLWRRAKSERDQNEVLQGVAFELKSFGRRQAPLARLYRGTEDWRRAIAEAPGSLRQVADQWRVSHTSVARFREEFGATHPDAKPGPRHGGAVGHGTPPPPNPNHS
jgi:hypothetical protein